MSQVKLQGNAGGSGSVTIAAPNTNSAYTATLPAATGDVMVSGNMPAFSATNSASQSVTSGVWTKVQLNSKNFDTNSYFDATTNYRFQPLIAGYYQINGALYPVSSSSANYIWAVLYKNGSSSVYGSSAGSASTQDGVSVLSALIYFNGTTDYIELYCYITGTSPTIPTGGYTYLSGYLARTP